jgi:hypothetical protein
MSEHFEANAVRAGIVHSSQPETIRAAASIVANAAIKVIAVQKATAAEELPLFHDGNRFVGNSFSSQTFVSWGRFPRPAA